jgi:hypothetical protein
MIYFMQPTDGGPIKIGFTNNLDQRRHDLEATFKRPLAILATMKGGRPEEAAIHGRFAHLRIGRTEQFRPAADLMNFIGRPLLVGQNPDTVEAMGDHRKPLVVQMRGSPEWKTWVEDLAAKEGLSPTHLVARAVTLFARENGYPSPPKR